MFAINQPGSGSNRWEKQKMKDEMREMLLKHLIFWRLDLRTYDTER